MAERQIIAPSDDALLQKLEEALYEIRRVIAGQEEMLERVLVCLLAGGHLLIEGVPGLAKTLTIKSTAAVLGGSFKRVQFTPDLVPSDLVLVGSIYVELPTMLGKRKRKKPLNRW